MKEASQNRGRTYSSKEIATRVAGVRRRGWKKLDLMKFKVQQADIQALFREPGVETLRELYLPVNELSSLPPEFGRLTALTGLYLSGNQLSSLPREFGLLTALTTLYLDDNEFSSLPLEICQLTALTDLHLNGNQLSSLPAEIEQLTGLTTLSIWNNQFSSLPSEICRLTTLTGLYLSGNQLSLLPPEIGQLTALEYLYLSGNQLSSLPPEIRQLTTLKWINLDANQLSSLPPEIGQLAALEYLDISGNQLSSLPPGIGQLTALEYLDISGNQLSSLPPEIGQLTALRVLYLNGNQLSSLPPETSRLAALRRLELGNNQLSSLPPEIGRLTRMGELYLHDNDALGLPPEILGATWNQVLHHNGRAARPADILAFYFKNQSLRPSDRRALNEVKVILVGQGSVGKTSLVKRIAHGTFNKREKKTDGIYIEKAWRVPGKKENEPVQVNFWDFGGQEIMHATHQFFLTKRTVYLLVLDARKGENESNIQYWLKIIQSFGGDAPVLVVTNKCDAHSLELNETRLKIDYPAIQGFYKTSCETGEGIEQLKAAIKKQIHCKDMKHVFDPLPKAYFAVKEKLEEEAQKQNYLDIREYHDLCRDNGVREQKEQDQLLRFLHDLGSVLSFNDPDSPLPLRDMSVLNPHWVTKGVYKILNDKALAAAGGVLTKADLPRILKGRTHPVSCHPFIVGMMHKFELCFTVQEGHKWLVAELLPKNEPKKLGAWDEVLRFQYHYEILPGGIICRFIVRRYEDLTKPPVYWRSGVVLEFDGYKALVRSDTDKGRMHIAVTGPDGGRRAVLAVLRDEFKRIHGTIPNLLPEQMVPLPDDPNIVVSYENLLTQEQQGVRDFIPTGSKKRYSATALLHGIEDPWLRDFGDSHLYPPLFVVTPQTSFADAWEVFCCEVLNRDEETTKIRRRKAPENGVDLYWKDMKVAYQCKSVEESTGRFSVTKAKESLQRALEIRKKLGWEKYVLCSNVALTGPQEQQLGDIFPDIEFLTPSYWVPRCIKQSKHLEGRFRRLTDMDGRRGA